MKEKIFISAVLYARNNAECIEGELSEIHRQMNEVFEDFELIVVNDSSLDETLKEIRTASKKLTCSTTVLNLARKHGIESAMMAGLEKSIGDFVFEIDALPTEYPSELFSRLFRESKLGYDIVAAGPRGNIRLRSRLFYGLVNRFSYLNLDLTSEHIRLVSRRALNSMLRLREKVRYRKALYSFTGYEKKRVEFDSVCSREKTRHYNRESITLALDVIVSFSNFGLKLSHYLSFVFFLFSLFSTLYGIYNYVFNQHVVPGWTTIIVLVSLGFAGIFLVLGIFGEYMSRILIEVQDRPLYTISGIEVYKPLSVQGDFAEILAATNEK